MKKFHLSALAASLALMAAGAQASQAPTAELYVKGTLDVPPCEVEIDGNGVYDYQEMGPDYVKPGTTMNKLDPLTNHLLVRCEGDTYLSYSVIDNQDESASVNETDKFGLGWVGDKKGMVGYYTMRMKQLTVDRAPVRGFATTSGTVGQNAANELVVRKGGYVFGWLHPTQTLQQIGKVFEADMEVTAMLGGSNTMGGPITDDVELNGSLTLNFTYGL